MTEIAAMTKILHLRELEKNEAQKAYQKSVDFFEMTAKKLYTLLKKKEEAEASYDRFIHIKTPIDRIKEQMQYIETLHKRLQSLQQSVQQARQEMETKQDHLTHAHVEVKKYEKIIEHRKQKQQEQANKVERLSLDEISIQQFLNRKNG